MCGRESAFDPLRTFVAEPRIAGRLVTMGTLLAIGSYAGPIPFFAAAVAAGAFMVVMARLGGGEGLRRTSALVRGWLILCALLAGLIILVSSFLLQRQEGIFALPSAAGAAGIMGLLTSVLFPMIAAEQGDLNRGVVIFGLVGGSVIGFVVWLAAFALFPRLHELAGIWP